MVAATTDSLKVTVGATVVTTLVALAAGVWPVTVGMRVTVDWY